MIAAVVITFDLNWHSTELVSWVISGIEILIWGECIWTVLLWKLILLRCVRRLLEPKMISQFFSGSNSLYLYHTVDGKLSELCSSFAFCVFPCQALSSSMTYHVIYHTQTPETPKVKRYLTAIRPLSLEPCQCCDQYFSLEIAISAVSAPAQPSHTAIVVTHTY